MSSSTPIKSRKPKPAGRVDHKLDRHPASLARKHIDIILVEPQKPENIGTTARAMANMGLGNLILIRPRTINQELMEATATSHGAKIIQEMKIFQELRKALEPYEIVIGTTARAGSRRGPLYSPSQIAPALIKAVEPPATAILFGPERMGLSTEDLRFCQKIIRIPTADPASSSLNLAQAVLIIGYELMMAAGGEPSPPMPIKAASQEELNQMYDDLEDILLDIGFLPAQNPGHWLMNIKKIFNRSFLSRGECNLLRGICRQIRWALQNKKDKS